MTLAIKWSNKPEIEFVDVNSPTENANNLFQKIANTAQSC